MSYVKLAVAALIPALATALLYRLNRSDRFSRFSYAGRQIFFGLIFGALAVLGTEWGIPLDGAVVNCRDAAPLCAGLFFGAPAGIIAGCIGALERWFAVYWGAGSYTRLACSVATFLAGVMAALLRKNMFESQRPRFVLAGVCAFMVEALHQSMVFFFHLDDAVRAAEIVQITAPPMLLANTLSVLLAGTLYALLDGSLAKGKKGRITLSLLIERNLLLLVVLSFLFTTAYSYRLQTDVAENQMEATLRDALSDAINSGTLGLTAPLSYKLNGLVHRTSISSLGYLIAVDDAGKPITSSRGSVPTESVPMQESEDRPFSCRLYGETCYALRHRIGEYHLIAAVPASVMYSSRNVSALATFFVQVFIYGLLFAAIFLMLRRTVVRSILGVNRTLGAIAAGDLDKKVDERVSGEFSQLSDDINATVDRLKEYIAEAKAANERELIVAQNIQLSALPRTFPAFPERKDLDIYALTQPAKEVGGDFYDLYFANRGHFYFLIADVSGKGIPAAMFMMRAKTQLKGLIEAGGSIEEAFFRGNNALCEGNDAEMFVTAWMADVDMENGLISFVNAGHNLPIVSGADGSFSCLKSKAGFVLAGMEGIRYRKVTRRLRRGERFVLYTDGVPEAVNPEEEPFGEERLLALVNANADLSAEALAEKIRSEVIAFMGTADQFDDITVLVWDYLGAGSVREERYDRATFDIIPAATEILEEELRKRGCPEKAIMQADVALDEILSNVARYAYPDGPGPVTLVFGEDEPEHALALTVMDEGIPYDPLQAAEPDTTLDMDERTPGGLGVFLVKKLMDEVSYAHRNGKNVLRLVKKF